MLQTHKTGCQNAKEQVGRKDKKRREQSEKEAEWASGPAVRLACFAAATTVRYRHLCNQAFLSIALLSLQFAAMMFQMRALDRISIRWILRHNGAVVCTANGLQMLFVFSWLLSIRTEHKTYLSALP
jgi:hypothetical protein